MLRRLFKKELRSNKRRPKKQSKSTYKSRERKIKK
jgi:hypothetical protein